MAKGSWSNGYTYETCASKLPTNATVVVTVSYDGTNATITETVNGTEAYTVSSEKWLPEVVEDVDAAEIFVALGGENSFNLSSVVIDNKEQAVVHSTLAPSTWNALSEFETVKISKGSSVSFTFTQPNQGENAWNSWAVILYDNETTSNAKGQFVRGDNWLNTSTEAGFKSGLYNSGWSSANGGWGEGFDYLNSASKLPTDAVVVVTVSFDGANVTINETINGEFAYFTNSENWK